MVKVVENGERICTVTLDGSESSVVFQNDYKYFAVKNESDAAVYVCLNRDIVEGADGVMTIGSKESALFAHMKPHVNMFFVKGTGTIQVVASNTAVNSFKVAPVSSGGGGETIAIDSVITADSSNASAAGSKAVYDFVTAAIAGVSTFHAEIVSELPSVGASNILYLVAKEGSESGNVYDEYLYIGGAWELVGSTDIDLSGYVTSDEAMKFSVVDGVLTVTYDDGGNT